MITKGTAAPTTPMIRIRDRCSAVRSGMNRMISAAAALLQISAVSRMVGKVSVVVGVVGLAGLVVGGGVVTGTGAAVTAATTECSAWSMSVLIPRGAPPPC